MSDPKQLHPAELQSPVSEDESKPKDLKDLVCYLQVLDKAFEVRGKDFRRAKADGKSLAMVLSGKPNTFLRDEVNSMISNRLGRTGPRLIDSGATMNGTTTFNPRWDLLHEAIQAGSVVSSERGAYRCQIGGWWVEWTEEENRILRIFDGIRLPFKEDDQRVEKMCLEGIESCEIIRGYAKGYIEFADWLEEELKSNIPRISDTCPKETAGHQSTVGRRFPNNLNRGSDVHRNRLPSEEKDVSTRSNVLSDNSILNDDGGDIEFAYDNSHRAEVFEDHRDENGKSAQVAVLEPASALETIAAMTDPASCSKQGRTREATFSKQVSSLKKRKVRLTKGESNNNEALRYLKDNLVCGERGFKGIVTSYNKKFGTSRTPDDLRKIYERHSKQEERPMKRKSLVAEGGRPEQTKKMTQAPITQSTSIETTFVSPETWNNFVPFNP